jgi:arginyl-tRNA synthetase
MAVPSLAATIADQLTAAIRAAAPEVPEPHPQVRPSEHADLQANGLIGLARRLERRPREFASEVASAAFATGGPIAGWQVAGPGFVNLTVADDALRRQVSARLADLRLGVGEPERGITTVIDYSAPNVAKHMHVGHLRSTVIGDALARVLVHLGGTVIAQNHIGDWGTQFGMLIQHLREHPDADDRDMDRLGERYRAANAAFESDPAFAERSRQRVVALQTGDADTVAVWRDLVAASTRYFTDVYERLGVRLRPEDTVGESFYQPYLAGLVHDLLAAGLARESEGAVAAFPPGHVGRDGLPVPLIVRKRDGGFGYAATDLAALRHRVTALAADRVLYVVGAPQVQHLRMVFDTAAAAGWLPDHVTVEHIPFGSVLGTDGRPLKTRSGRTPRLVDLVDEAVARARDVVTDRNPDLPAGDLAERARHVGVGAVKYADLSTSRGRDYTFDPDRMVSLTGNTGTYLQYAHARVRSILRKVPAGDIVDPTVSDEPLEPAERRLALQLDGFAEAVVEVAGTREPHRLCGYLFALAQAYTTFYETCPVLAAPPPRRGTRLALCRLTGDTLRTGLDLLGIAAPERL